MRIFLCGAQGVGKSTLATNLPKELGFQVKDSYSKNFLKDNPDIQNSSNVNYDEFQDKILLYCLSQYVNDKNFISSRSIVDSFAYLEACQSINEPILHNIICHYQDYVLTEDCIYVYIPIEFDISDKGNQYRNTSLEYQMSVDRSMQKYFSKLEKQSKGAKFYKLSGTKLERLGRLLEIIKESADV